MIKRLFQTIRVAIISKRQGYIKIYCPSCGKWFGNMKPMTINHFLCGCGAEWKCCNHEELFDKAYPDAGKEDEVKGA